MFSHQCFEKEVDYTSLVDKPIWIVHEKFMYEIEREWLKNFDDDPTADPYSKGASSTAILKKVNVNTLEFQFFLDRHTRYHHCKMIIRKELIRAWVSIPSYHKYDYVFVDSAWHDEFWSGHISAYLLIDMSDMRDKITNKGLKLDELDSLSEKISCIAEKYRELLFISTADNILIKANFAVKARPPYYTPEVLVDVCLEIFRSIKDVLGLDSYGIFTQGLNIYNSKLFEVSKYGNHINLRSLGAPYSDLFNIEKVVRKNVSLSRLKDEPGIAAIHLKKTGYFNRDFFYSLNFDYKKRKTLALAEYDFENGRYIPIDVDLVKRSLEVNRIEQHKL